MRFSHVFISRPQRDAEELEAMLAPLGLEAIIQPAFDYAPVAALDEDPETFAELESAGAGDLLVFTSPRAVAYGLPQVPREVLSRMQVAAIGPASTDALSRAGIRVTVSPSAGYTSEDLLDSIDGQSHGLPPQPGRAFIVAAPGGREALLDGLTARGWRARLLPVYRPVPVEIDRAALQKLGEASSLLSVWTSGNAMAALAQRLPPASWFRICQGEWLVISERLRRLARAYGPAEIHLASGPGNAAIVSAIRSLL
jgi:uroporphyrinogen-III synthase